MQTDPHYAAGAPEEPMLFSARLVPHRSLSGKGFLLLMGFFGLVSFTAGIAFTLMGAWPVLGFFGLDLLAIFLAFRINYIRGRACEEIALTATQLRVRQVSHRGQVSEWTLNPLWVRLDQIAPDEFGLAQLDLVSSGRRVSIAGFLGAEEKLSFAKALSAALAAARRGVPLHPAG